MNDNTMMTAPPMAIEGFKPFQENLVQFKKRYDGVVYDMAVPEQNQMARSDRLAIGKIIGKLDTVHRELKAPLKAQTDLLDLTRKSIKDDFLGVQQKIKDQIKDHEDKIAAHEAMLCEKVAAIGIEQFFQDALFETPTPTAIKQEMDGIHAIEIDDSFEYKQELAVDARTQTLQRLELMLDEAQKKEAQAAELAKLRREAAEREAEESARKAKEMIAERERAVAERATKEAEETAERKIREAEEATRQAEQDKARIEDEHRAVEARAKRREVEAAEQAEREKAQAIEAERQRVATKKAEAERVEAERVAAEERAAANKNHQKRVIREAVDAFVAAGRDQPDAERIVEHIHAGTIPHVTLNF